MFRIDFNKLRFLVCDDNPHMRRILRTLLHSFGAREVYESEDGATALEMYTHYVPDIVITDWAMPIFDGLELSQMIRQPESKGNPYAPIIMLTGHSEKRRVTVARDAGVTEFLAKPISAKGLYQRILNVVANPRPFIKTKTYFGPDRRRNTSNTYIGPERRVGGEMEVMQQPSLLDKAEQDQRSSRAPAAAREELKELPGNSMAKPKSADIEIKTFADHHVITQPNPLRKVLRRVAEQDLDDPVARAEKALAGLSGEFRNWMVVESDRLAAAYAAVLKNGFNDVTCEELFRAAHDIKGDAATFGFPSAGAAAESLCRIIEHAPDLGEVPPQLIAHHINAIQAIVGERTKLDTVSTASELSRKLRGVADEYLMHVNRDRPEHLEAILAPSIVPAD